MSGFTAARVIARPVLLALIVAVIPPVWGEGIGAARYAAEEIRLRSDASRPGGMEMATLAGDMGKPGLYAARIRIPAGLRVLPHTHPEDRLVIVLSGTLLVGYGGQFDVARMKALPPGGFFTEPAGQPHFAWARDDDVIVQVSGIGPSATVYVEPGHAGN